VQVAAWEAEGDADAVALEGDARGYMFRLAGFEALDKIHKPFRYDGSIATPDAQQRQAADREAGRVADGIVRAQCRIAARARAIAAVYRDPERRSQETVDHGYERGVSAWAWSQGSKEADAVRQFNRLIVSRSEAEEDEDDREVARIDARLLTLTGIPHPVYPDAAWTAADTYSGADRQAEYDRLTEIWGPRHPAATTTNGTKPAKTRRLATRALTTTGASR
jgi:hypothetical protein